MKKYKFEINGYGHKVWYWKGLLHRDNDKPAVIYAYGGKEYWKNGERVDKYGKVNKV